MLIDATEFIAGTDMCGAIAAACAQLGTTNYPLGATIDARGFTGNQVCAASNITTMLNGCIPQYSGTRNTTSGKLLLGEVNLYADGPSSGNYIYGTGSGAGTPALVIPAQFWGIEGVSRGADASGTNAGPGTFLSVCTGNGTPISKCTTAFPQRTFGINTIGVSGSNPTVMTITIPSTSMTVYLGELAMVAGAPPGAPPSGDNGTFAVQGTATSGSDTLIMVTVPSGTATCSTSCGNLILGTPILGFGPGGGNKYNAGLPCSPSCAAFGMHIKNLGFNCQGSQGIQGCMGWQNLYAQEESGADTFLIDNFNFVGFDTHGNNAQNFGPILNAEILTGTSNTNCANGTTGAYIAGVAMRGFDDWSINTTSGECSGSVIPNAAVILDATDTEIRHGHCQVFTDCVLMGANNPSASGLRVTGIGNATPSTNVVHISANNKSTVTDFMVESIQSGNSANTLQDDINGITLSNPFLSLYSWSQPSGAGLNLVTTDTTIRNQFGSGVLSSTYGTTANCASTTGSCGTAAAGAVTIASGTASSVTVSTSAVTTASDIKVQYDESIGGRFTGGITCNTGSGTETASYWVSARATGSFTIKTNAGSRTNPICLTYMVVN